MLVNGDAEPAKNDAHNTAVVCGCHLDSADEFGHQHEASELRRVVSGTVATSLVQYMVQPRSTHYMVLVGS